MSAFRISPMSSIHDFLCLSFLLYVLPFQSHFLSYDKVTCTSFFHAGHSLFYSNYIHPAPIPSQRMSSIVWSTTTLNTLFPLCSTGLFPLKHPTFLAQWQNDLNATYVIFIMLIDFFEGPPKLKSREELEKEGHTCLFKLLTERFKLDKNYDFPNEKICFWAGVVYWQ